MRSLVTRRDLVLEHRARILRSRPTRSEAVLLAALRGGALGAHFQCSVRVGGFIADFLAPRQMLILEVDGASHRGRRRADARRDRKLQRLGYRVLRLEAELVLTNLPEALARIRAALAEGS
jgi:very-short-patch-repair endonuclease